MADFFTPDYMFENYACITPQFLAEHGIRALLIDIDNTLAPYEQAEPDEKIRAWFSSLAAAGISVALVSNNHPARVELFNRSLGLLAFADSKKPHRRTLLRAMRELGANPSSTAMLGDQLLTDAYAGKHIGLPAIILPPIRDKKNLFFRFKRWCERPFIKKYANQHGYAPWMSFWRIRPTKTNSKETETK